MSQSQGKRDHKRIVSINSSKQDNSSMLDKLNLLIDERHKKGKYLKAGIEPKKESRNTSQDSKISSSAQQKAKSRQSSEDPRRSTSHQKYQSNQVKPLPASAKEKPSERTRSTSSKKERVEDRLLKHLELREKMLKEKQKALDLEIRRPVDPRLKLSTGSGLHPKPHLKPKQAANSPPRKPSPAKVAVNPNKKVAPARNSTPSPPKPALPPQQKQVSPPQKRAGAAFRNPIHYPGSLQTSINGPSVLSHPGSRVNQSTNTTAGQPGRVYSPSPTAGRVPGAVRPRVSPDLKKSANGRVSSIPKSIIADLNERAKRNALPSPSKGTFGTKKPVPQPAPRRKISPHNPSEANTKFGQSDHESEDSLERAVKASPKPAKKKIESLNSSLAKKGPNHMPDPAHRPPAPVEERAAAQRPKHAVLPPAPKALPVSAGPLRSPFEKPEEQRIQQVSTDDRLGISESLKSSLADEDFIHLETLSKNGLFSGKDGQEDDEEIEPLEAVEPGVDLRTRLKGIFEKSQRLHLQAQGLPAPKEARPSNTLATMTYKPKHR